MDVAQFVLDVMKALVWPALILALVLMFRRPLSSLLHDANELTVAGLTVKTGDRHVHTLRLEATRRAPVTAPFYDLPPAPPATEPEPGPGTPDFLHHQDLAERGDRVSLKYLPPGAPPWGNVLPASEIDANESLRLAGVDPTDLSALSGWSIETGPEQILTKAGVPSDLAAIAGQLWKTRFDLVHGRIALSDEGIADYVVAVDRHLAAMEAWAAQR